MTRFLLFAIRGHGDDRETEAVFGELVGGRLILDLDDGDRLDLDFDDLLASVLFDHTPHERKDLAA